MATSAKTAPAKKPPHKIVSRDQWLVARKALLAKERDLTHQRDAISAQRRELPWVKVEKDYVFNTPRGKKSLAELFEERSQLVVYHFMLGPGWEEGCPSCSYLMDHVDGMLPHLHARDVTFTAISRGPIELIEQFKKRMGWKFPWASSFGGEFNYDYHVSFEPVEIAAGKATYNYEKLGAVPMTELPGLSVFAKNAAGEVFHTYSTYARGLDSLVGTYHYLDLVPKGRDEEDLAFSMAWVRHHDKYGANYFVDAQSLYHPPRGGECPSCAQEKHA